MLGIKKIEVNERHIQNIGMRWAFVKIEHIRSIIRKRQLKFIVKLKTTDENKILARIRTSMFHENEQTE